VLRIPPAVLRISNGVLRMPALARRWPPSSRARSRRRLLGATPTAEAFRSIRTSVLSFNPQSPPRSLLVTSSQPPEGKTATTINLGVSFAQLSRRAVVVDADMRHARCHRTLGVKVGPRLSD